MKKKWPKCPWYWSDQSVLIGFYIIRSKWLDWYDFFSNWNQPGVYISHFYHLLGWLGEVWGRRGGVGEEKIYIYISYLIFHFTSREDLRKKNPQPFFNYFLKTILNNHNWCKMCWIYVNITWYILITHNLTITDI